MELNQDSLKKIGNIVAGFKAYPAYKAYDIKSYCYDFRIGVHALQISKGSSTINLWLFYPGYDGEIESIAIYGANLRGHLNAIRSSMTIFGLPVESAEMDGGMEDFVDVYLKEY